MDPIFPQDGRPTLPIPADPFPLRPAPAFAQRDRLGRLAALAPEDKTAALVWLALHAPATCDAMLDATESDLSDPADGNDGNARWDPEPYCAACGAAVGIFLRFGLDWRHYRGEGTIAGQIEIFDPGHPPVPAWRPARVPAAR